MKFSLTLEKIKSQLGVNLKKKNIFIIVRHTCTLLACLNILINLINRKFHPAFTRLISRHTYLRNENIFRKTLCPPVINENV